MSFLGKYNASMQIWFYGQGSPHCVSMGYKKHTIISCSFYVDISLLLYAVCPSTFDGAKFVQHLISGH
jgi:hypothetical protein